MPQNICTLFKRVQILLGGLPACVTSIVAMVYENMRPRASVMGLGTPVVRRWYPDFGHLRGEPTPGRLSLTTNDVNTYDTDRQA